MRNTVSQFSLKVQAFMLVLFGLLSGVASAASSYLPTTLTQDFAQIVADATQINSEVWVVIMVVFAMLAAIRIFHKLANKF